MFGTLLITQFFDHSPLEKVDVQLNGFAGAPPRWIGVIFV